MSSRLNNAGIVLLLVALLQVTHYQCAAQSETEVEGSPELAPAPAPEPLPLPDPEACTGATFHEATSKAPICGKLMYNYEEPEEECCEVLREYYGVNSTKPSRNCFCIEPYWTRLMELEEITYMYIETHLLFCEIPYFGGADGLCSGVVPEETASAEGEEATEAVAEPHSRSFGQWIRDLKGDALMSVVFTLGLVSLVGFFAMLWPLVTDTVLEIYKMIASRRAAV